MLNSLTPVAKQPAYYYVKQEPVEVTPEVENKLDGRVLTDVSLRSPIEKSTLTSQ